MKRLFLDAREMEHPQPLERAITLLRELGDENYLYMIHYRNPIPLITLAKRQNFTLLSHEQSERLWHILICKNKEINLNRLLDTNIGLE